MSKSTHHGRTVTRAAELDALPIGSVIRPENGSTWAKEPFTVVWQQGDAAEQSSAWGEAGVEGHHDAEWLAEWGYLPAAVLYEAEVEK